MVKVPDKKVIPHTRHEYRQLECVADGFFKTNKVGVQDQTKLYTTLFCVVCGEKKEILAASNLQPNTDITHIGSLDVEEEPTQEIEKEIEEDV